MPPPPEATHPEKWPRPLRSFLRLFGLDNLSHRKLRQLRAFFLQVVMVLSWHVARCGVVAEHPAPPTDRSRPSIWTFLAQISDHGRFGNDNGEHEHPNRRVCSRWECPISRPIWHNVKIPQRMTRWRLPVGKGQRQVNLAHADTKTIHQRFATDCRFQSPHSCAETGPDAEFTCHRKMLASVLG